MLALRAWRPPLVVTARAPLLAASYSQQNQNDTVLDLVNDLTESDRKYPTPPRAGPEGYAPGANPFVPGTMERFIKLKSKYRLHCHSTLNNTITTFTKPDGSTVAWFSGGSCGFKKGQRASYEAGYQCAVRMFKKIEEFAVGESIEVELFFKGFGQGREALHRALMTSEGEKIRPLVGSITDRTAIKIGGTRAPKTRRL